MATLITAHSVGVGARMVEVGAACAMQRSRLYATIAVNASTPVATSIWPTTSPRLTSRRVSIAIPAGDDATAIAPRAAAGGTVSPSGSWYSQARAAVRRAAVTTSVNVASVNATRSNAPRVL